MEAYKRQFIDFMVEVGVLTFGDFTTKSGRKTPYFVNTGLYRSGTQLQRLGEFYADAIQNSGIEFDVLFGPAYKGIPLVVTTAMALAGRGQDVAFCFNRKEAKDHGEGGTLVGHKLSNGDRVLIIEDVTTAGTSIRETVPVLRSAASIELAGLVVSVDRGERGTGEQSALSQVGSEFAMPTHSIVNVHEIIEHVDLAVDDLERMHAYLAQYGATS
ncbi:MAG: orotate phosphoribosyltransferase [Aureliella sp.]